MAMTERQYRRALRRADRRLDYICVATLLTAAALYIGANWMAWHQMGRLWQ